MTQVTAPDRAGRSRTVIPPAVSSAASAVATAASATGSRAVAAAGRWWNSASARVGVLSPVGAAVLAGGTLFLAAGLVLGWPEFTFLGITMLGALAVAALFLIGRASYRVAVEIEPTRVVVGDRALGRLIVSNTATRRATASRMELPVGRGIAEFAIPGLDPAGQHEELFAVPTNRRAVIVAGPVISIRGDQLGLLRRTVRWTQPQEIFVHPRTARLDPSATGLVRDLEGESSRTITASDISFHALRPYEPGDALRNVHWRTSARIGTLMVRQFEETRRSQLLMAMSGERRHYAGDDEFELAVSLLASIALQVVRDGTNLDVVTERRRLHTATPVSLLDDTCRIESHDAVHTSLRSFVRAAGRRLAPPSVAIVITGSQTDLHELREVRTVFGDDVRLIAIRADLAARPRVTTITGLTTATVSMLSELPRIMRKVAP